MVSFHLQNSDQNGSCLRECVACKIPEEVASLEQKHAGTGRIMLSSVSGMRSQDLGRRGFGELPRKAGSQGFWVTFLLLVPLPPPYFPRQKPIMGTFSLGHRLTLILGPGHQALLLTFLLRIRKANGCTVLTY